MNRAARTITIPLSWAIALIAGLTCALCLSMAIGAAPAYAGENAPAADGAGAVAGTDPAAVTTNPAADPKTDSSTNNSAVNANAAATNAPATTITETTSANASANNGLGAAAGPSTYASDDGTDDFFIGLTPVETDTQAYVPYGDMPANANVPAAVNENPVYVGITAHVGDAVDLAVAVDYMRVNANQYTTGDTVVLPSTISGTGTAQNADTYRLAVNWYYDNLTRTNGVINGSPLAQGVYYTNLTEYQRVTGLTSVGTAQLFSASGVSGADAFTRDGGISDPYERFEYSSLYSTVTSSGTSYRLGSESTTSTVKARARYLRTYNVYPTDREHILFFESSGTRVVTAQATLTREIINNGITSYIVYASVPVVFYIDVRADVNQGTIIIEGEDQNKQFVEINSLASDPKFEGSIFKKYKHLEDYAGDSDDYPYDSGENYVAIWEGNRLVNCATRGTYKICVKYLANDTTYKTLVATFTVGDDEFANGATVTKTATLQSPGDPDYYWVKFINEDGTPLGDPQRYEAGATITSVPTPTKAQDGRTKYVHYGWTAVETDQFEHELPVVAENTTYRAWYSTVPLDNIKSANGVSASGGLIDQQPAAGDPIASYELAVTPLDLTTIPSAQYGVTITGPNNTALNAYRVHITQHNHDGSTAWLTTNVGAINLTLKVDGVADGTQVRIVQIHEKDAWDPNDTAESFTYSGIVQNGTVTITLPGKMSTFVVTTDLEAQGEQEGTSDDPSGDTPSGDDSSSSTTPEQSGDPTNTNIPSAETSGQEPGAAGDNANDPAASGDEAVTRGVPAADPELGADGVLADGPGEDVDDAVTEGVKAAPGTDDVKTPETGDSPLAPLALMVVAVLACVVATRNGVLWARSRR